jgi:hypothetical protein
MGSSVDHPTAAYSPRITFVRRRVTSLGVLVAALMTVGLVLAPMANAAGNDTPDTAQLLTALPTTGFDSGPWAPVPPATDAANVAVANRCNGGSPIYVPRWYKATGFTATSIVARGQVNRPLGRDTFPAARQGVAVLNASTRQVLDCSVSADYPQAGPVIVTPSAGILVVVFLAEPMVCFDDTCIYDRESSVYVAPSAGYLPNDDWANAGQVVTLPFTQTVNTQLATSQAVDSYASPADCSPQATGNSKVTRTAWWTFTPAVTGPLAISVNGRSIQDGEAGLTGSKLASVAVVTATGPQFVDPCTAPYPPVFLAGKQYLIEVGDATSIYHVDEIDSGGPVTLSISGAIALARPDLVVTDVSLTPASPVTGNPVRFRATIKNQGTASTPGGIVHGVSFKVDGVTASFSDSWTASLPPGGSVTLTANGGPAAGVWAAKAGAHTVLATVDDINRIKGESNEANNTRSKAFTVAAATAKPDLVVTAVSWTPANPAVGAPVRYSATVKNQGAAATPAGVIHGVLFKVDGVNKTFSDTRTASLAAGASVTLTANGGGSAGSWPATAGPHTVQAFVDDVNRISESNDANNTLDRQLTVGPVTSRPDLVVTAVTWSPASAIAGNAVRFSATIKNQGTGTSPAGVVHGVSFRINGAAVSFSDTMSQPLHPGQTVTVSANGGGVGGTWKAVLGAKNLQAFVDDVNRIPGEANEGNNRYDTVITVK